MSEFAKKDSARCKNETDVRLIYVPGYLRFAETASRAATMFWPRRVAFPKDIYVSVVASGRLTKFGATCVCTGLPLLRRLNQPKLASSLSSDVELFPERLPRVDKPQLREKQLRCALRCSTAG